MSASTYPTSPEAANLESRVAARLAGCLSDRAAGMPHDVTERLRFAREKAVQRARAVRRAEAVAVATSTTTAGSMTLAWQGPPSLWIKLASLMPLVVLALGLVLIQHQSEREQIAAAADVDAALLSDDLPPSAYRDPGFAEYLRQADAP